MSSRVCCTLASNSAPLAQVRKVLNSSLERLHSIGESEHGDVESNLE